MCKTGLKHNFKKCNMEIQCIIHNILIHRENLKQSSSRAGKMREPKKPHICLALLLEVIFHSTQNLNIYTKGKPVLQQQFLVFHRVFCKCTPMKLRQPVFHIISLDINVIFKSLTSVVFLQFFSKGLKKCTFVRIQNTLIA